MNDDTKLKAVPKVTILPVTTTLPIPVERVLDGAAEEKLQSVIVIGWDAAGDFYFAASATSSASVLWDLERAKKQLLEVNL